MMKVISATEAHAKLRAALAHGERRHSTARWSPPADDGRDWVLVDLPLDWVAPNAHGVLSDNTVDSMRARTCAGSNAAFKPIHLHYGSRLHRCGIFTAAVMDGGRRVSAARIRGDSRIAALMPKSEMELLLAARVTMQPARAGAHAGLTSEAISS
ncbi:hypothetical protein [Burkholderia ubonensis]|uniref:hypothetical protein n=1 Tax=Burkholderia ubonensis TaxID=101571 RepID=UPI00075C91D4|nr:hypothetical protein [Burkholderia ubonensis]KVV07355.1 hypothetical protein WK77_16330 [Burkholderia ubonensis]